MAAWTITKCDAADLAQVADLVNAAYRGEGGQAGWASEVGIVSGQRTTSAALEEDLATSAAVSILVLRLTMLDRAEAEGLAMGAEVARMTVVSVRETLIAWYERHGYRRTGETERFPYDDTRFGVPLRSDLEFVVLEKRLVAAGA
jgi:hypothetical protein